MTRFRPTWWHFAVVFSIVGWFSVAPMWVHDRFIERPFLTYENLPFPVTNSPVVAGTDAVIHVERCSNADRPRLYPVSHSLDGAASAPDIRLGSSVTSIEPGCEGYDKRILIPRHTPAGTYRLTGTSEPAGTVKTFSVPWESQEFEVIKGGTP